MLLLLFGLLLAMAFSAWTAWSFRHLDHLGLYHDDAIYLTGAKSLVETGEYRMPSLPGDRFQTKFPPLYPILLSIAWQLAGDVPANLPAMMLVSWLAIPLLAGVSWLWLRRCGLGIGWTSALCAAIVFNPTILLMGTSLMTDVWFAALAIASIWLSDRAPENRSLAFLAGLLAGLAFLTRSAGIVFVASGPLFFLMRKQWRSSLAFLLAMIPCVAGWMTWCAQHKIQSSEYVFLYYLDYFALYKVSVSVPELPHLLYMNLWTWILGVGRLLFFNLHDSGPLYFLTNLAGLAAGAGLIRRLRQGIGAISHYDLFALFYVATLLIYMYPPNQRFSIPLLPLLMAGLWLELRYLGRLVRSQEPSIGMSADAADRSVRATVVAGVVPVVMLACSLQAAAEFVPASMEGSAIQSRGKQQLYDWVRSNTPVSARFYAFDDPTFYLHTGRQAISMHVPSPISRREDRNERVNYFRGLDQFADRLHLDYVVFGPYEFTRDLTDPERKTVIADLTANPTWILRYSQSNWSVYQRTPTRTDPGPSTRNLDPGGAVNAVLK